MLSLGGKELPNNISAQHVPVFITCADRSLCLSKHVFISTIRIMYRCMSGSAVQKDNRLKAGSIASTVRKATTYIGP